MISQSFSPGLKTAELFTRRVQFIRVTDLIRKITGHMSTPEDILSTAISITFSDSSEGSIRLNFKREACRFGGYRWWAACPICNKFVASLYWAKDRVACRKCQGLKYMSQVCSNAPKLMHHYARLRERFESKPGPKPDRYWRYLAKEDQYVDQVMEKLSKRRKRMVRRKP
jgi:hypothetical protein